MTRFEEPGPDRFALEFPTVLSPLATIITVTGVNGSLSLKFMPNPILYGL